MFFIYDMFVRYVGVNKGCRFNRYLFNKPFYYSSGLKVGVKPSLFNFEYTFVRFFVLSNMKYSKAIEVFCIILKFLSILILLFNVLKNMNLIKYLMTPCFKYKTF